MRSVEQLHIGTYTNSDSKGIYTYELEIDQESVAIRFRSVTPITNNPSFLAAHPTSKFLYVIQEVDDGTVTAFERTRNGSLRRLNRAPTGTDGPCHCYVAPSGEHLFVAHYTGGAVSVLPIDEDGQIAPPSDLVHHEGSSVHPERQTCPHPHSAIPGPNGQYIYVPDLGTDEIVIYELDSGTLKVVDTVSVRPGAGPRHLTFHPNGEVAYVINELNSTLTAYEWTAQTGMITEITTVSTVPRKYDGENITADVHVHPSGAWVYGSNRGHDSIAVFAIGDNSDLTAVGYCHSGGQWPRNFTFNTTGKVCLVGNRKSNSIIAFRFNESSGMLEQTKCTMEVPTPACLHCLPANIR